MWKWDSQCGGSASYLFDFPLISHSYSLLYLHFTSHQPQVGVFVLPDLLIPHPEWAAAVALPQGCFREGAGREGLACRYEQTVTTDGSGVAAALPGPHCSLPPGWRPRPINPKPCHLFSSLWIQKKVLQRLLYRRFSSSTHLLSDLFPFYVFGVCRPAVVSPGSMWQNAGGYSCECLNCCYLITVPCWLCNKQDRVNTMQEKNDSISICWDLRASLDKSESVYLRCQNNDWICLLQVTLNCVE